MLVLTCKAESLLQHGNSADLRYRSRRDKTKDVNHTSQGVVILFFVVFVMLRLDRVWILK